MSTGNKVATAAILIGGFGAFAGTDFFSVLLERPAYLHLTILGSLGLLVAHVKGSVNYLA